MSLFDSPMPALALQEEGLWLESVSLDELAAKFGTPLYVYSMETLRQNWQAWANALKGRNAQIHYAVKANSNVGVLSAFARLGAHFDIVSVGELTRVIMAGADPSKVVFSGVGKSTDEITAALNVGIHCFNVESASELQRLENLARELGKKAPMALRVNPDVDPKTHPYISTGLKNNKFGVAFDEALRLYRYASASPHLDVCGIACHIGSQLLETGPILEAGQRLCALIDAMEKEGIRLDHIDLGGGLGIRYRDETPPSVAEYLAPLLALFKDYPHTLCFEPGRSLVGNAGLLLTRIEYLKPGETRHFAVVDAAMNDLARPALYDAWHDIVPTRVRPDTLARCYEVVGPVCESGDFLGHERTLAVEEGDLLAILSAGAYGMTMSSNYNSRPRAAEVLVDGSSVYLIRKRESLAEVLAGEQNLDFLTEEKMPIK
jgi:diaminopimelate decarboxylase